MALTRSAVTSCPFFGAPKPLPSAALPTNADVVKCWHEVQHGMSLQSGDSKPGRKLSFSDVADTVAVQIESVYLKASIPTVSHNRVVQKIKQLHDRYYGLRKSYSRDKMKDGKQEKYNDFIHQSHYTLFDIAFCKCEMTLQCNCGRHFEKCICPSPVAVKCTKKCPKEKKIPTLELKFLYAQRYLRIGKIQSTVDKKETQKITSRLQRKTRQHQLLSLSSRPMQSLPGPSDYSDEPETDDTVFVDVDKNNKDSDFELTRPSIALVRSAGSSQMRIPLPATALTINRFGVSDRATAAITSSVLKDLGLITDSDTSLVIDRSKIRREKEKCRQTLTDLEQQELKMNGPTGLYFDGRSDDTLVLVDKGGKRYQSEKKEEHISVVEEPGSKYLCHLVPASKCGKDIAVSIANHFEENAIDTSKVNVVGCDGTSVNTGWKGGVIKHIEMWLKRPVHWAICLLHFNELPLRHLVETLDGKTTGLESFSGPLGKQLARCESLPVVAFERIECHIPQVDPEILSKDQRYLYDIAVSIAAGQCSLDLANRDPGPISHSRWLTTANRFLRLYVSSETPPEILTFIVTYIMTVYVPLWFEIKTSSSILEGPKHLYECIRRCRSLPAKLQDVVKKVIQTNAFFAHPENLLLSMVMDERQHVRELGLRRVLKSKPSTTNGKGVRTFLVPTINFDANDYSDLIFWPQTKVTCPPLFADISSDAISDLISSGEKPTFPVNLEDIPCHTQAVERTVKLVTQASTKVYGHERRNGFIRATLASRATMPKFETKSEFTLNSG